MGFRERVMRIPWVYKYFILGISKPESGAWFANEIIRAAPKARILDVGCGPADMVSRLGEVSCLGIDHDPKHIESAHARFGPRAEFRCCDATDTRLTALGKFDIVLMLGVLHHLTDCEIRTMLQHTT